MHTHDVFIALTSLHYDIILFSLYYSVSGFHCNHYHDSSKEIPEKKSGDQSTI